MIGWLLVILLIGGMLAALVWENRKKRARTAEEFERDVRNGTGLSRSMFGAGLAEIDKAFAPSRAVVAETVETERRRREADEAGDDPDPVDASKRRRT